MLLMEDSKKENHQSQKGFKNDKSNKSYPFLAQFLIILELSLLNLFKMKNIKIESNTLKEKRFFLILLTILLLSLNNNLKINCVSKITGDTLNQSLIRNPDGSTIICYEKSATNTSVYCRKFRANANYDPSNASELKISTEKLGENAYVNVNYYWDLKKVMLIAYQNSLTNLITMVEIHPSNIVSTYTGTIEKFNCTNPIENFSHERPKILLFNSFVNILFFAKSKIDSNNKIIYHAKLDINKSPKEILEQKALTLNTEVIKSEEIIYEKIGQKIIIVYFNANKQIRGVIYDKDFNTEKSTFTIHTKNSLKVSLDITKNHFNNIILTYTDIDPTLNINQIYFKILDEKGSEIKSPKKINEKLNFDYYDIVRVKTLNTYTKHKALACYMNQNLVYCRLIDFKGNLSSENLINGEYVTTNQIILLDQFKEMTISLGRLGMEYYITMQKFYYENLIPSEKINNSKVLNKSIVSIGDSQFWNIWKNPDDGLCYFNITDLNGNIIKKETALKISVNENKNKPNTSTDTQLPDHKLCQCIYYNHDSKEFVFCVVNIGSDIHRSKYLKDGTYQAAGKYGGSQILNNLKLFISGDFRVYNVRVYDAGIKFNESDTNSSYGTFASTRTYTTTSCTSSSAGEIANTPLYIYGIIWCNDSTIWAVKAKNDFSSTSTRGIFDYVKHASVNTLAAPKAYGLKNDHLAILITKKDNEQYLMDLLIIEPVNMHIKLQKVINQSIFYNKLSSFTGLLESTDEKIFVYFQDGNQIAKYINLNQSGIILTKPLPINIASSFKNSDIHAIPLRNGAIYMNYVNKNSQDFQYDSLHYAIFNFCNFGNYFPNLYLRNNQCDVCDTDRKCRNLLLCEFDEIKAYPIENRSTCFKAKLYSGGSYATTPVDNMFKKCQSPCETCAETVTSCNICDKYLYLTSKNTCVSDISNYFLYKSSYVNIYKKCDRSCVGCTGATNVDCKECNDGKSFYPKIDNANSCHEVGAGINPPQRYIFDPLQKKFVKCLTGCLYCNSNSLNDCKNCDNLNNYYNKKDTPNICTNTEPGYYADSVEKIWKKCDVSCVSCVTSAINCVQCNTLSGYYGQAFPENGKNFCYKKDATIDGLFFNSDLKKFSKCDISCLTCISTAKNCLKCNENGSYYSKDSTPNTCENIGSIPDGYFFDLSLKKISPCEESCSKCIETSTKCTSCNTAKGYFPVEDQENICKKSFDKNYFLSKNDSMFKRCHVSCIKCETEATNCTECNTNYLSKYENKVLKCITECPEGTWKNIAQNECSKCDESCKTCEKGPKFCKQCAINFYEMERERNPQGILIPDYLTCKDKCPERYELDEKNLRCKKCPKNCLRCSLENKCLECLENFYLNKLDKFCYDKCAENFYANEKNKTCEDCKHPCRKCSSENKCLSCAEEFFLLKEENFNLALNGNNNFLGKNCLEKCPLGSYGNYKVSECVLCKYQCKTCSEKDKCFSCIDDYSYFEGDNVNICVQKCPDGFFSLKKNLNPKNLNKKESLRVCQKCPKGCSKCLNFSECISCEEKFYYLKEEKKCYERENCPIGFWANKNLKLCEKCHESCMTCKSSNKFDCLTCDERNNLIFRNGFCIKEGCPIGFAEIKKKGIDEEINKDKKEERKCVKILECIEDMKFINLPRIFNIEDKDLLINFQITYNQNCPLDIEKFDYKWNKISSNFKEALIKYDNDNKNDNINDEKIKSKNSQKNYYLSNTSYLIKKDLLKAGKLKFIIDLIYNDEIFFTVEKKTNCVLNKLIPIINTEIGDEAAINFIYGYDIKIDASQSNDEKFLKYGIKNNNNENKIEFKWVCPKSFKKLCNKSEENNDDKKINENSDDKNYEKFSINNEKFLIKFSDYKEIIKKPQGQNSLNFEIKLIIRRFSQTAEKLIKFIIKNEEVTNYQNSDLNDLKNIDLTNLIYLKTENLSSTDLLIKANLINKKIELENFNYFWTIPKFQNDSKYLNGRKEINLRIKYSDLLIGKNKVIFSIFLPNKDNKNPNKIYKKIIYINKTKNPYGGNCVVNPPFGFSFSTEFEFNVNNWKSSNLPLIYKIKYLNKNDMLIDITNGGFMGNKFSTKFLPVAKKFVLEIIDNQGLRTLSTCNVNVKENKELKNIEFYVNEIFENSEKLLIMELYETNSKSKENKNSENKLNLVGKILENNMTQEKFIDDYDNIISSLLEISTSKEIYIEKIYPLLDLIMNFIDPFISNLPKMEYLYKILDKINKKFQDENKNLSINESDNNQDSKKLKTLSILQNIITKLDERIFNNIIAGQGVFIVNENFDNQLNKISVTNPTNICVEENNGYYSNSDEKRTNKRKLKFHKIRRLQNKPSCENSDILNLNSLNLKNLMNEKNSNNLGFQSQYIKNKYLPVTTNSTRNIFSKTSLDFELSLGNKNKLRKLREIEAEENNGNNNNNSLEFNINLDIPDKDEVAKVVKETCCVQYQKDNKNKKNFNEKPFVSCKSWYNETINKVICSCNKQGLTVNLQDKELSDMSKLMQFPKIDIGILNIYSIGIMGCLVCAFLFLYVIAGILDEIENKTKIYMNDINYDFIQYYSNRFYKENLHENLNIFKLYFYLLKNLHPIISLLFIYSPSYGRPLRVMDFFMTIYLTFFFQLLPIYYSENDLLNKMINDRNSKDIKKTLIDLDLSLKQIFDAIIYTYFASFFSLIIMQILSFIFYFNIIKAESLKNRNLLRRAINIKYGLREEYHDKLKHTIYRLNTIILLTKSWRKEKDKIEKEKKEKERILELERNKNSSQVKFINSNSDIESNFNLKKYFDEDKIKKEIESENRKLNSLSNFNYDIENNNENNVNKNNKFFQYEKLDKSNSIESFKISENENTNNNMNNNNDNLNTNLNLNLNSIKNLKDNNENNINKKEKDEINFNNFNNLSKIKIISKASLDSNNNNNKNNSTITKDKEKEKEKNKIKNKTHFKLFHKLIRENITDFNNINNNNSNNCLYVDNSEILDNNNENNFPLEKLKTKKFTNSKRYNNNQIVSVDNLFFPAIKIRKEKKYKKIISLHKRNFNSHLKEKKFSCFVFSITNPKELKSKVNKVRSCAKKFIVVFLYLYINLNLMIFINGIYKNYADNIFKLCVMPLISMILIKLCITFNIKIFISSIVLYFFGPYYLNRKKHNILQKVLLRIFVSPMAYNHYAALMFYKRFIDEKF